MLAILLEAVWVIGAAASVALLLYGGYLAYVFHSNASVATERALARLALHESPSDPTVSLTEMKATADNL